MASELQALQFLLLSTTLYIIPVSMTVEHTKWTGSNVYISAAIPMLRWMKRRLGRGKEIARRYHSRTSQQFEEVSCGAFTVRAYIVVAGVSHVVTADSRN